MTMLSHQQFLYSIVTENLNQWHHVIPLCESCESLLLSAEPCCLQKGSSWSEVKQIKRKKIIGFDSTDKLHDLMALKRTSIGIIQTLKASSIRSIQPTVMQQKHECSSQLWLGARSLTDYFTIELTGPEFNFCAAKLGFHVWAITMIILHSCGWKTSSIPDKKDWKIYPEILCLLLF